MRRQKPSYGLRCSAPSGSHPPPSPHRRAPRCWPRPPPSGRRGLAEAREQIDQPGDYVVYEESGELRVVPLTREWTRVGRSLAADVRFDDPTVSRRHALIVRQPDGVRLLDDRSLNGVFVNGTRVDGRTLSDGDEIVVGRYRLVFLSIPEIEARGHGRGEQDTRLHSVG